MRPNITPLSWPPWVEVEVMDLTEVRITVSFKTHTYSWPARRGEAWGRDTLRVANQVYAGLVEKQCVLDAVTKRLTT